MKNKETQRLFSRAKRFMNKWVSLSWDERWQNNDHEVIALVKILKHEGSVNKRQLSEASAIIQNLKAYSMINTVTGVRYLEGSHQEFIDKAEEWLSNYHKGLEDAK